MEMPSLNELDINEPGEWPQLIKVVAIVLLCIAVLVAGYYMVIQDKQVELAGLEQKEQALKTEFETKQAKAFNLDAY